MEPMEWNEALGLACDHYILMGGYKEGLGPWGEPAINKCVSVSTLVIATHN